MKKSKKVHENKHSYKKTHKPPRLASRKQQRAQKEKEKWTLCDISPSLHCLSPLSCPKTPKLTVQVKKLGSTEIWTRIAGFKVQSANHYTIEPGSTRMGFEPTRAEPIGLAVQRLNHLATSSVSQSTAQNVFPRRELNPGLLGESQIS